MALGMVGNLRSLVGSGEATACQKHLMAGYVLARLAHGVAGGLSVDADLDALRAFLAS